MSLTPQPGILNIAPYKGGISKVSGRAQVIKLSSNENPFGASAKAREAYLRAVESLHRYPDGAASELRDAIAQAHSIDAERVVCGAGSDEIISLLCKAYAGPGNEVIYTAHGFLMYPIAAMAVGATPIKVAEQGLRANVDAILAAVNERTRIVFLANPNNPTGSYLASAELDRLRLELAPHVLLVVDEAYAEYVEAADYKSALSMVESHDNVVVTRTFSKIYGLAALRLGWGYAPAAVVDVLHRIRGPFNVSTPGIKAGVAALADIDHLKNAREHNTRERAVLSAALSALSLKVYPSEGNFLLVEFPKGREQANAALAYAMSSGVIVRAMESYQLPNCLRVTIGFSEENTTFLDVMRMFLDGE